MSEVRRILVVGMQRSGTTVTLGCLAGHPETDVLKEEIHASFFGAAVGTRNDRGESRADRTRSFLQVFDHVAGRRPGSSVVGFKTALPDAEYAARLVACLQTHGPGIDLIVTRRRDLVAQLGSLRRAEKSNAWHSRVGVSMSAHKTRVRISSAELAGYVAGCVASHALLDALKAGRRTLELEYERDIVGGTAWSRLFEFLGIDDRPPDWLRLRKHSPAPDSYIENYAGLSAELPGLMEDALRRAPPAPIEDARDSRVFLLHRAQFHQASGRRDAALEDALAALASPSEWGVETREWACATIRSSLEASGDMKRAAAVAELLRNRFANDVHAQRLVRLIQEHLDRA